MNPALTAWILGMTSLDLIFIALIASGCALLVLIVASRPLQSASSGDAAAGPEIAMLFSGTTLEHITDAGLATFATKLDAFGWLDLVEQLEHRFPGLPKSPQDLDEGASVFDAVAPKDKATIAVMREGEVTRVEIIDSPENTVATNQRVRLLEAEIATLQRSSGTAPYPMWQIDPQGRMIWKNAAYDELADCVATAPEDEGKPLFEDSNGTVSERRRAAVTRKPDGKTLWFDVSLQKVGGVTVGHAVDIEAVIDAEVAQRNFVQTLAKTFAQLSIGLAIFDRNGQLALFNPAMVDLTRLPAEFLSARPDLLSFFDRLRDKRMMPEPKNYHSWRQEIADLIAAAEDGRYQETWTLDSGQTYRVSGRPHPDRAVAFLIEDISAEILVTRNFRAELELGQSLMDTFDDALVVFSSAGVLTFCNQAYRAMWSLDPDNTFADITVIDSLKEWQTRTRPDPSQGEVRDFVMKIGERATWNAVWKMTNGDHLEIHVTPIAAGATLVRFHQMPASVAAPGAPLFEQA